MKPRNWKFKRSFIINKTYQNYFSESWELIKFVLFLNRYRDRRLHINKYIYIQFLLVSFFFILSNAKHRESIVIGLAASSTSKGQQIKTTEPMVSIKVTNCSIQLGWILAHDGYAKNYSRSRPEAKKCHFFI